MSERTEALRRFPPPDPKRLVPMFAPQTVHQYGTVARTFMDEMERLHRSDQSEYYRRKKLVRQAIKERERGQIRAYPDIPLTDLRQIKKEMDLLYG